MLRFDMSSIQGVIHLKKPFIILLDYMRLQLLCLLWKTEPERILIIGLGAGILPKMFHYLSPNTLIDVVEIDIEIMNLAQKYFDFNQNDRIRVYIEDGRHFIERQPSNQYDVIIIDAFTVKNHVPHRLHTIECVSEYLRILKSTGLVIGNFFYEQESRYRQTYERAFFKQIYQGVIKNNYILIGLNKQTKVFNQNELQLRARDLQQNKSLFDMNWIHETKHIHNENNDKWNRSTRIFTDKIYENSLDLLE
ncbi:unnamed protein product [Rotaria sp. Silwood2]|nr:unnamed protein product [Rotaria sp. Silwood2]CAF2462355.1 unnamed protein product [Rotaria sp. Silwood2]CAF2698512.1 unnamed protein product [Rotaria sp. Silwood2]CAF2863618.1 unnamed protein product [Rotaria sp. Silwood2]CAF4292158.1 unnamed protein product [Rotaria sp. Silwood2]